MNTTSSLLRKKQSADRTSKIISLSLSWLFSLIFFLLIIFIVIKSINGFEKYGWSILGGTFNLDDQVNKASVWLPLCITIMISILAIAIAAPVGIKTAMFIKYRLPVKYQKSVRIAVELLADIPSVIFGLFACEMLGMVLKYIFHMPTSYNLITTGFMLTFMILPTIVSLSLNALDGVDKTLISASMVLGNTKTRSIYKVCKKDARNGIAVGTIIAFARAIGETMAVSMILQSQGYNPIFNGGFLDVATSGLRSLGSLIAANMFAEGGGPALQSLLFAFGLFMFIFVMILNGIAMYATKKRNKSRWEWWNKFEKYLGRFIIFVPTQIKIFLEKITYRGNVDKRKNLSKYVTQRIQKNKFIKIYTFYKIFWEIFSITLTIGFLAWITLDIVGFGGVALSQSTNTIFSFANNTTGQAFINTLLIIIIAIGISLPFSLLIAIYLNEFAKEGRMKKTLLFFIDSLGATPSILFGMFGLIFFIQTLGMSDGGVAGKSLLAGALTILIVILPVFIRTVQQALQTIPKELRTNSYALGAGKWETIKKIVLPAARQGITTAIVLSVGRILAETAPLYLTSGLTSSSSISLMNPGQTLTTRIYAQIYTGSIHDGTNIMYECAFVTMFLVLLIILVVHVVIPAYYNYKQTKLQTQSKNTRKIQELFELGHLHFQKIFNKQDLLIRTKNSKINDKKISLNSHRGPSHTSKRWLKRMSIIFLCLIPIGTITAFAIEWSNKMPISCIGSSGVKPFIENLSQDYMKSNKNVDITIDAGGSGFGIEQIANGFANIGNASKDPYNVVQKESNGFRDKWTNNNIKTVTIGWEGICMVYIPPKGLNLSPDQLDKLLVINQSNIQYFMRVFSGIDDHDPNKLPTKYQFLGGYINDQSGITLTDQQKTLLDHTSIIPYVRAGGSLTSGTAASFIGNSNLGFNEKTDLSSQQQAAFDNGNYGTAHGLVQTDEANSRAWDIFAKSNHPGEIVYLSSGFIAQNLELIRNNGYGIMAYGDKGIPFNVDEIDTIGGYNWFRPLNTMLNVSNTQSNEVKFVQALISDQYQNKLEKIGAKKLQTDERDWMLVNIDNNNFASDVALAKHYLPGWNWDENWHFSTLPVLSHEQ